MFHGVANSEILRAVAWATEGSRAVAWATEGSSAQRNDWKFSDSKMVVASAMHGLGVPYRGCQ